MTTSAKSECARQCSGRKVTIGDWLFTLNLNPLIIPVGPVQVTCTRPSPTCDAWILVGGPGTVEGNKCMALVLLSLVS